MKTYETLGLVALILLVVMLPVYALQEPARMARAQAETEARYVNDAAHLYLDSCALYHGADGAGLGAMPPLNYAALAEANAEVLTTPSPTSPHGSAMASWHVDEGGTMSSYQVESLVTLIKSRGWDTVSAMAFETPSWPSSRHRMPRRSMTWNPGMRKTRMNVARATKSPSCTPSASASTAPAAIRSSRGSLRC